MTSDTAPSSKAPPSKHRFRFFRAGGLDQARLDSAKDLLNLELLDQKLWAALACPVKGLELDEKTLALIDSDSDGRIRAPELIAAIKWASGALDDPARLIKGGDKVPLDAIKDPAIQSSAREILSTLGKKSAKTIRLEHVADMEKSFVQTKFNGDGIVTPDSAGDDTEARQLILDILATRDGALDRSGKMGVNAAILTAFYDELKAFDAWTRQAEESSAEILPFGADTAAAAAAIAKLRSKVDDFFARSRLAAFDPQASPALNPRENEYLALAGKSLSAKTEEIAALPIARIEAGASLPLEKGVNPAWAEAVAELHAAVVTKTLGAAKTSLSESEWNGLEQKFEAYEAWMAKKAGASVEKLGIDRIRALIAGTEREKLEALIARDLELAPRYDAIVDVERLIRYHRDLYRLLLNFVSLADFYSPDRLAVFQAGTLYLDARACELVVRVGDPAKHALLAGHSKAYLTYCDCTRPSSGEKIQVVAAFTNGDSDYLMVGRNGIFYDRDGRDWDATITKIIDNPISIRQAFWAPYKKLVRMIEDQVVKRAATAEAASDKQLAGVATEAAHVDKVKTAEPRKLDIGTIAAIGIAVSGIVAVLTAIIGGIMGLSYWQIPLAILGVLLLISGPSMLIAGLKLRQRNLGPILDANGWAINGRVKINLPFGASLTELARLPKGAQRSLDDPYREKKRPWWLYVLVLVLLALAGWFVRWDHNRKGHYFWQNPSQVERPTSN